MVLTDAITVLSQVWVSLADSGMTPFVYAGALLGLVGMSIKLYRKIAR